MVGVFEAIRDFFSSVFFPRSSKTIQRKKLKQIFNNLKALPNQLLTKELFVQPDFAKLMFSLYVEVLPIRSVFEQTLMNEDIRIANRFKDMLLQESFSDWQKKEFYALSYPARAAELQKESAASLETIQKRLKDQSKRFHTFLHDLRTPEMSAAERNIQHIYTLYDFCCFDYYGLLSHFTDTGPERFDEIVKNGSIPKFHKISIDDIIKELLDFQFVLKNLIIDNGLLTSVEIMHKKATSPSENKFLFIMQQISTIKDILEKELANGSAVLNMIRYAKKDPDFTDSTLAKEIHVIDDFIERMESRFSSDMKKLLRVFQEDKIGKLVNETFGEKKFFGFAGYNAETNQHLQSSTSLSFDWIRPLELLRTFTKQNFEVNMKLFIKTILVEGFFTDNNFQKNLGAAFYYCENLSDKFEEFERLFTDGEKCSLAEINGYLKEIDNGADFEKQLAKLIDEANVTAKNIVQSSVEQYTALYTACTQLIADAKKHNAELISNVKVLFNSTKLRSLAGVFERDVQTLKSFLEIMKNYAVLVKMDIN